MEKPYKIECSPCESTEVEMVLHDIMKLVPVSGASQQAVCVMGPVFRIIGRSLVPFVDLFHSA